jgi:hypothetical protein
MKWVIAILLALNLWLGVYGLGQTFNTLNIHRDMTATELRSIRSELEAVQELLYSLDATYSDEYMELIKQRYIKLTESD